MEIKLKEKSLRNFYVSSLLCTHILLALARWPSGKWPWPSVCV